MRCMIIAATLATIAAPAFAQSTTTNCTSFSKGYSCTTTERPAPAPPTQAELQAEQAARVEDRKAADERDARWLMFCMPRKEQDPKTGVVYWRYAHVNCDLGRMQ